MDADADGDRLGLSSAWGEADPDAVGASGQPVGGTVDGGFTAAQPVSTAPTRAAHTADATVAARERGRPSKVTRTP